MSMPFQAKIVDSDTAEQNAAAFSLAALLETDLCLAISLHACPSRVRIRNHSPLLDSALSLRS
jgi:hypothetical protein